MIYFSPGSYPEIKNLGKKSKKKELDKFFKAYPKAKAYLTYPFVVIVSACIPFIKSLNHAIFNRSDVLSSGITGGLLGGLLALVVIPIFASGPVRKLFLQHWENLS